MSFGEKCSAKYWEEIGDPKAIYDFVNERVNQFDRQKICREFGRSYRTMARIESGFWYTKLILDESGHAHLVRDAFFTKSLVPNGGPRSTRFLTASTNERKILEYTRDRVCPVATVGRNLEVRLLVKSFALAKRILIASFVKAIANRFQQLSASLKSAPWVAELSREFRDYLTPAEMAAVSEDSIPVDSVVALCVEYSRNLMDELFAGEGFLPHAIFFGVNAVDEHPPLPRVVIDEGPKAVLRPALSDTVSQKHENEAAETESLQLKFVKFSPGTRRIDRMPHYPNKVASDARLAGLYSNIGNEDRLFHASTQYGAEFDLQLNNQVALESGDIRSKKAQQFLNLMNSWIRKERLAEGLLLEYDSLHVLPIHLQPSCSQFVSIEQQIRATICGDLHTIKGDFEWSRLPPTADSVNGFRKGVLKHYQFYLATVAQILTSKSSHEEARRFLFELLRATFTHYPNVNGSDSEVQFGDLNEYCNELFRLGNMASGVDGHPALSGVGLADAYLRQENVFEQEMEALLAGIEDEKLRQRVVDRMTDAKENRFNAFMEALVSNSGNEADDSVTREIKSMFDGGTSG